MAYAQAVAEQEPGAEGGREDSGEEQTLRKRLRELVIRLQSNAEDRVRKRKPVEDRWIEDLRQYQGKYTRAQLDELHEIKGSTLFVNLTRPKTNVMVARLTDLLFPTDDRNWGIRPTPVPELVDQQTRTDRDLDKAQASLDQAVAAGETAAERDDVAGMQAAEQEAQGAEQALSAAQQAQDELHELLEEAKARSDLMQEEMDDHLKQARYGAQARDMIEDACKMGTGIMKGPVVGDKVRSKWAQQGAEDGSPPGYQLTYSTDDTPGIYRVDPWSFFPEPDARRIEDSSSNFERHLMTPQQLRRLARRDDIDDEAIRRLLRVGIASSDVPAYLTDLQEIGEHDSNGELQRYVVWEFTGALEREEIALIAEATGDDSLAEDMALEDVDPLEEMQVRVWFCQGELLGFAEHPLDSGETLYSVFNLERDEATIWGFGIPYLMRADQKALNAGWRMMLDNAGLSSGPQILINRKAVTPQNGSYVLEPHKVWLVDDSKLTATTMNPFQAIEIGTRQDQLANIIQMARTQMDEVTAMPQIAQGEQGATPVQTAQGMSLLMNAANVVFRRVVRNFDDDMTVPNIRRLYHFLMQFSEKEEIKGDYEVDARGSSVLLVREMQAQNLMVLMAQFGQHPAIKEYRMLREIFRAHMLSPDELMETEAEVNRMQAEQQEDPVAAAEMAKVELERERMELTREEIAAKIEIANMDADTKRFIAEMQFERDMNSLAEKLNVDRDRLDQAFQESRMKERATERRLAAEIAMKERTGVSSGGSV